MAGKKGHSGPPGNLNASRNILPALRRLRKGKPLPPELARIAAQADRESELLVLDKGGIDGMTGGEQLMLNIWRTSRQCVLLILTELIERGAVQAKEDGSWDLQPGATRLAKFLSEERAALLALGLSRRAKDITPPLSEYLAERYGGAASEDRESGEPQT